MDGDPMGKLGIYKARLMYHSSWCALGTNSVRLTAPWGNVRSMADGLGKNSTGGEVFLVKNLGILAI